MISTKTLDACEQSLKAALKREEGLAMHNQLLLREVQDISDRYKVAVNALVDKEREVESLKALYER